MEFFGTYLEPWQVWVICAILSFIIEIFTPAFVAGCLGIGCLAGALADAIGLSFNTELIFFSIGTIGSFIGIRPFILKVGYRNAEKVKTNADNMLGKIGKVTEEINADEDTGLVALDGDVWKAISEDHSIIEIGTKVVITHIDSIIVTVKNINH